MSDEFEDREQVEELGALPADLIAERQAGPVPPFPPTRGTVNMRPASIPGDIPGNARIEEAGTRSPNRSPSIPAGVNSVYDARPINARDWVLNGRQTAIEAAGNQVISVSYTVPDGYIGVWRTFICQPVIPIYFPRTQFNALEEMTVNLYVDSVAVPDFNSINIYDGMRESMNVFALANSKSVFKLELLVPSTLLLGLGADLDFKMQMYGQLLQTRGMPLAFEIATQQFTGIDLSKVK
jgi:hypothetical protein